MHFKFLMFFEYDLCKIDYWTKLSYRYFLIRINDYKLLYTEAYVGHIWP